MTDGRHVLVLGSAGFLGAEVARASVAAGDRVTRHVRRRSTGGGRDGVVVEAELSDVDAVVRLLDEVGPDLVVNCAALADVDACERDPDLADTLNHRMPARIAAWTAGAGVRVVHVSTDSVFDGRAESYDEDSPPSPVNVYGRTKADGEAAVLGADPTALVARTNIVGWSPTGTRSLLEFFHHRLSQGEPAPGFVDIQFRPLPVHWFWPICERFLAAGASGVIHVTGPELLSKYAFGRRVALAFDLDPELVVPTEGLGDAPRAVRPPRLDVRPSRLAGGPPWPGDLDQGLAELRRLQVERKADK